MLITELIWLANGKALPENDEHFVCSFCKKRTGTIKFNDVIGGNFPLKDLMIDKAPFCEVCANPINDDRFRKSCWFIHSPNGENKIEWLDLSVDKEKIVDILLKDIEPPYYIALTRNKKKHLIFGNVCWNNFDREVVFDGKLFRYNVPLYRQIYQKIDRLYNDFLQPKKCIKNGEYATAKLTDVEFNQLLEIEGEIKKYRKEISFDFFVDMLIKKEKEALPCKELTKKKPEPAQLDFWS